MNRLRIGKYSSNDRMSDIIGDNYYALLVLSRFNIPLGFGERTVSEICGEYHVDTDTFLAVINLMNTDNRPLLPEKSKISLDCLIEYLSNSHSFFLKFRLPEMRQKLTDALNGDEAYADLNRAVTGYFDKFAEALKKHTNNEEKRIFPYIKALQNGEKVANIPVILQKQHEQIQYSLTEFKNVLIKYYPARQANKINSFLFDIFNCEKDLASHNAVEEFLFQPIIDNLEKSIKNNV